MERCRTKRTPKASTRERKTATIRCRPYTYDRFKDAAAAAGQPFSRWAIDRLLAACDGRDGPDMRELSLLFTVGRHLTRGDG